MAAAKVGRLAPVTGGHLFHLASSKTDQDAGGAEKPVLGKAGAALSDWAAAGIVDGALSPEITKGGKVTASGIQPNTVSWIIQKRSTMADLDPRLFAGHSLRSGCVTETGMQGKPMGDIMALSGHRTFSVVIGYYPEDRALNQSTANLALLLKN